MGSIYKLIVMALMTSEVTFGYRRAFDSRHRMKGRRIPGEKSGRLDPAYDFFKTSVIKKPIIQTEIHLLPEVYVVKENKLPPKFAPRIKPPPKIQGNWLDNQGSGFKKQKRIINEETKVKLRRPLVHILNKESSEIGKAIEKYMNTISPDKTALNKQSSEIGKGIDTSLNSFTPDKKSLSIENSKIGKVIDTYLTDLSPNKKREIQVDTVLKPPPDILTAGIQNDNQVPPLKESFPVPVTKVLDMHALGPSGPGPYRNCFPPSLVACGSRLPWAHVIGMTDWCEQNCDKEAYTKHCDDIRCTCKCLSPGEPF